MNNIQLKELIKKHKGKAVDSTINYTFFNILIDSLYDNKSIAGVTFDSLMILIDDHKRQSRKLRASQEAFEILANALEIEWNKDKLDADYTQVKPYSSEKNTTNYKEAYEKVLGVCEEFISLFESKGASDEAIDLFKKRINKAQSKCIKDDKQ